jgi:hypothetical protein
VGVDAKTQAAPQDDMSLVEAFARREGVTFTIGLDANDSYAALVPPWIEDSPFPLDLVVGPDGRIAYLATQYDPEAIRATIDSLLKK